MPCRVVGKRRTCSGSRGSDWSSTQKTKIQLSNEENPGCLGYMRDEILPSYVGMRISHGVRIPY